MQGLWGRGRESKEFERSQNEGLELTYPPIPIKFKITEGQPKSQPKPGKGPHCHGAPVSLLSPRKSDVLLTTMLAAMTSGSTQIDSTKKVYSKEEETGRAGTGPQTRLGICVSSQASPSSHGHADLARASCS